MPGNIDKRALLATLCSCIPGADLERSCVLQQPGSTVDHALNKFSHEKLCDIIVDFLDAVDHRYMAANE